MQDVFETIDEWSGLEGHRGLATAWASSQTLTRRQRSHPWTTNSTAEVCSFIVWTLAWAIPGQEISFSPFCFLCRRDLWNAFPESRNELWWNVQWCILSERILLPCDFRCLPVCLRFHHSWVVKPDEGRNCAWFFHASLSVLLWMSISYRFTLT